MATLFEDFEGRIPQVNKALKEYGFSEGEKGLKEALELCKSMGFNPYEICQSTQQICFEDAKWAYVLGSAIAIKEAQKSGDKTGSAAAANIGKGLQAFCLPGSVADDRKVGIGHGNLGARLLSEETQCFAFLAGHESFAAAEGAIKIAANANKVRKNVQTQLDYFNGEGRDRALKVVKEVPYGNNPDRLIVKCYGADDVREGVAIMWHEDVDVSITGNSTNPTRFQHPVAGTYKKERLLEDKNYFSVASGGGTGRTLHPDNMAAGPASYGFTDTLGRMHSDAQFAGSSSVPAHVEMMGFMGMGNNPMVGCTVACAVAVEKITCE